MMWCRSLKNRLSTSAIVVGKSENEKIGLNKKREKVWNSLSVSMFSSLNKLKDWKLIGNYNVCSVLTHCNVYHFFPISLEFLSFIFLSVFQEASYLWFRFSISSSIILTISNLCPSTFMLVISCNHLLINLFSFILFVFRVAALFKYSLIVQRCYS